MAGQNITITQPDGNVSTMPAPGNIVFTCPPSAISDARMLRANQYTVADDKKMECSAWPLFSVLPYAAAGQTSLVFFQAAAGQGTTTIAQTNMQTPSMLPNPQQYLITGLGFRYISGLSASTIGASSANSVVNDTAAIMKTGVVQLNISSKKYTNHFPLSDFPVRAYTAGMAALSDSTTAGAGQTSKTTLSWGVGEVFKPIPLLLTPNMNFDVTVLWPTAIAIPSADASAQLECVLYGQLFRPAQ